MISFINFVDVYGLAAELSFNLPTIFFFFALKLYKKTYINNLSLLMNFLLPALSLTARKFSHKFNYNVIVNHQNGAKTIF